MSPSEVSNEILGREKRRESEFKFSYLIERDLRKRA